MALRKTAKSANERLCRRRWGMFVVSGRGRPQHVIPDFVLFCCFDNEELDRLTRVLVLTTRVDTYNCSPSNAFPSSNSQILILESEP